VLNIAFYHIILHMFCIYCCTSLFLFIILIGICVYCVYYVKITKCIVKLDSMVARVDINRVF